MDCSALCCAELHFSTLLCAALLRSTLRCAALRCAALRCAALPLHFSTLHCTALLFAALRCPTLLYDAPRSSLGTALRCSALLYVADVSQRHAKSLRTRSKTTTESHTIAVEPLLNRFGIAAVSMGLRCKLDA
jgi:hypothetical protein